jgi:hypothetical protein
MLEIPEQLKSMFAPLQKLLVDVDAQVSRGQASSREAQYERFEVRLTERLAEVERAAHEATLSALDINAPRLLINGELHVRVLRDQTTFMTQAGGVPVLRSLYRRAGDRNGRTVDPVALRANAIDGVWLPGVARDMAFLVQQGTSREAQATAKELGRLPYSRSSFERVGHIVGETYVGQHESIEEQLIEAFDVPPNIRSLSVSLDRVSIPMEEPRPKPVGRPTRGAPKKPIVRVYRMAYCGTLTMHDGNGDAVHTIRYGTMPAGDAAQLCEGLASDALALLRKRPELRVSLLCDGAPEMWNLLDTAFDAESFAGVAISRRIDFWHVIEKLAPAAQLIAGSDGAASLRARWKTELLRRSGARAAILDELIESGKEHVRVGDTAPVHDAITYLTNNHARMDYAAAKAKHLPIGSGNVEATCKSLVGVRMKRPGARWKTDTGEHVIHLRALALSDRWAEAMDITLRPPRARIRHAA